MIRSMAMAGRAIETYLFGGLLCASFEITHSCNARCKHCHLGGKADEEVVAPERYGQICRELRPLVTLISGGEPLLRKDVEAIVSAIRNSYGPPYIAMTTNGLLLTARRYGQLRNAGVDRFSVSIDYPDERHDDFRGMPGLFKRIADLTRQLDRYKDKAINISCVVQRDNFRDIIKIAELGKAWDVMVNFSTYTWLRTANTDYVPVEDELPEFRDTIEGLIQWKRKNGRVRTSDYVLRNMVKFFANHGLPGCQAGRRYVVVNADGTLSPCGLIMRDYRTLQDLRQDFSRANDCQACYTSLRADCERPLSYLARDTIRTIG
jgi:MoaA/NifB/PqqE/SkfB family radical SAM enzyme